MSLEQEMQAALGSFVVEARELLTQIAPRGPDARPGAPERVAEVAKVGQIPRTATPATRW